MPVQWKLYAIANYIFCIGYSLLLFLFFKFLIEEEHKPFDAEGILMLLMLLIFCSNTLFNIINFHRYFPDKVYSNLALKINLVTAILFLAALVFLTYSFSTQVLKDADDEIKISVVNISFLTSSIIFGLFIFICQLRAGRFLIKRYELNNQKIIDSIGQHESIE